MLSQIVTHPGGAHKDDFLAVCVLVGLHGVRVERREPSEVDVQSADRAVVDVGGSDDAALSNFDHHHFPREHPPTCALSLVLKHLGLYEDALLFCPWLEPAEWFDSRGPKRTAEWLGVSRDLIPRLNSPIDITLLRRFAAATVLEPGEPLYEVMRFIGEDMVRYLKTIRERIDYVASHVETWSLSVGGGQAKALFLPRTDPEVEEPSGSLAGYVRAQALESTVVALAYPDRRGGGYGLTRYEDHPCLDFCRVSEEPDVHFAHKSGFVCKTSARDPARLQQLIERAWKSP